MGKNSKPILSVLVDEEKKEQFAELARRNKYSMGWLLNDCIDRMLEADSIGIYRDSIGNIGNTPNTQPDSTTGLNIEELVKSYVDNYLSISSIGNKDAEEIVKSYVDKLNIETLINTSIGLAINPITNTIDELETYVKSRFEELETRPIVTPIPTPIPAKLTDEVNKPWAEFFKMVGIDALTATEAQKKENIDIRAEQIARGIQTAKEQGLGEWAVKVAGRSFVRVGNT